RDYKVTGVQTCALPISSGGSLGILRAQRGVCPAIEDRPARERSRAGGLGARVAAAPPGQPRAVTTHPRPSCRTTTATHRHAVTRSEERRVGKECRYQWW